MFKIAELASRARVDVANVRFYERQGLVLPIRNTAPGDHLYTEDALWRIAFAKNAQRGGFSFTEIRQLLELHTTKARRLAVQKQSQIEDTIIALRVMSIALSQLFESRLAEPTTDRCNSRREPAPHRARRVRSANLRG